MGTFGRLWSYIHAKGLFRNIRLRMFKFSFEWDVCDRICFDLNFF